MLHIGMLAGAGLSLFASFGRPIPTEGMTDADRGFLTDRVRDEIERLLDDLEGAPPGRAPATQLAKDSV